MRKQARSWGFRAGSLFLLCGLPLLAGCGDSQGTVSGKVSYKGKPLRGGVVSFITEKGGALSVSIQEDGSYTVAKVPTGPAKITVETQSIRPSPKGDSYGPAMPPKEALPPGADLSQLPMFRSQGSADKYVEIPQQYSDPQKSGLTCTVKSGKQEHNIDLQ